MTEQSGDSRFAGGSGDGNHLFAFAEFGEHFRAVEEGDAERFGFLDVWIVGFDGRAVDDGISRFGDAGAVLWENFNANFFQILENIGIRRAVGAGNGVSGMCG